MADASRKVALAGSERRPLAGAVAIGRTRPDEVIQVTLKLRRRQALSVAAAQATPMTRAELAAAYGAAPADIAQAAAAVEALGLRVVSTDQATRSVIVAGPVSAMEAAFDIQLFDYRHPDGGYRGRVGALRLPAELDGVVVGVFGLDNRRVARRRHHPARDAAAAAVAGRAPAQFAQRYNFPPGDGAGQTVGLLEFGGGYFPADLAQFCGLAGVAAPPTVTALSVDGAQTNAHDGEEGEVMLDIEVVAGVCPKASIVVYFAAWTEAGWIAALDKALQDGANDPGVISISWGAAEDTDIWSTQAMTQINEALKEAIALRITVCVAAGDDGSSDAVLDGHAHVDFPGSSPLTLAVGGTTIPAAGADVAWKIGTGLRAPNGAATDGSTGGGVSAIFPREAWQSAVTVVSVNPGAIVGRCVPDLAANADWSASPYLLVVDGQAQGNGGTSAAAPLVASLIARLNAARTAAGKPRAGYVTPLLYQAQGGAALGASACTPVLAGDNVTSAAGGYHAGAGYNAVGGWGVPNGGALLRLLP
jgi:kumamolisin